MLPKGIADFIASCGLEAEDLPAPDKLVLSPRLLGAQRRRCCNRRCGNQCKGGYHEQYLVHGNLRGLRRSIVSCRNLTLAPYCARAARGQARKWSWRLGPARFGSYYGIFSIYRTSLL